MKMVLESGEVFEHSHRDPSITELISGSVELSVGGTMTMLLPGVAMTIPADAPHVLVNRGPSPAVVKCVHIDLT